MAKKKSRGAKSSVSVDSNYDLRKKKTGQVRFNNSSFSSSE